MPQIPEATPAFRLELDYHTPLRFDTMAGQRGFYQVARGVARGARFNGVVADDGGDWATLRPDGVVEFDSRMMLRAEDGTLVYLRSRGVLRIAQEQRAGFDPAGAIPQGAAYFGTTPYFDAPLGPHDWLTKAVFVGKGRFTETRAEIDVFEVL